MSTVAFWLWLGLIPVMPSGTHTLHVPSYGAKAPVCKTVAKSKSSNGLLKLKIKECK